MDELITIESFLYNNATSTEPEDVHCFTSVLCWRCVIESASAKWFLLIKWIVFICINSIHLLVFSVKCMWNMISNKIESIFRNLISLLNGKFKEIALFWFSMKCYKFYKIRKNGFKKKTFTILFRARKTRKKTEMKYFQWIWTI